MSATSENTPQVQVIASTPGVLNAILACATSEQLKWKPNPNRWSISEVLGHLVDVELRVIGLRARRIAQEDNPEIESYDQNAEYAKGTYSGKDGRAQLERFCRVREESLQWLRPLPLDAWKRGGHHPEVGEIKLENVVSLWAFHDLGHIKQIAELYRAKVFWDSIGPLQKFYRINP